MIGGGLGGGRGGGGLGGGGNGGGGLGGAVRSIKILYRRTDIPSSDITRNVNVSVSGRYLVRLIEDDCVPAFIIVGFNSTMFGSVVT